MIRFCIVLCLLAFSFLPVFSQVILSDSIPDIKFQDVDAHLHFTETLDCVDGEVVYQGSQDYYVIETAKGFTICELYYGSLSVGDLLYGELNSYNFKYIFNKSSNSDVKVWIDDYMLSKDSAIKYLGSKGRLSPEEQKAFNSSQH